MSQLAMSHGNGLRISPQSFPPPSHMPTTSAASAISMIQQPHTTAAAMSPQNINMQSPVLRSPSPSSSEKKQIDVDDNAKDGNALNMTISPSTTSVVATSSSSPSSSSTSVSGDIRTNSITALRIKAKEHLENINKNLTMV